MEIGVVRGNSWYLDVDERGIWSSEPLGIFGHIGGVGDRTPVTGKWK